MLDKIKNLVIGAATSLKKQNLLLVTAESCTGGGLSYWLTSVPGCSSWFERGFVTYSNTAKSESLGIDPNLIKKFGAVSEETAKAMAEGALNNSHAEISLAITGIAGPEGGSEAKPVGTVFLALARKNNNTIIEHHVFSGDRQNIRLASIVKALEILLSRL